MKAVEKDDSSPTGKLAAALHFFTFLNLCTSYMLVDVLQLTHKWLDINTEIGKVSIYNTRNIRSVERGICPIATSTMNELFP